MPHHRDGRVPKLGSYRGEDLNVRLTKTRVEFFLGDVPIKTHARRARGRQTDPGDLPPDRTAIHERTPQWCLRQAREKGPSNFEAVQQLLAVNTLVPTSGGERPYPSSPTPERSERP